jgi:hypothetical protein
MTGYGLFLLFFGLITIQITTVAKKALVVVPVADLLGAPIKTFGIAPTVKESYQNIALCGGKNNSSQGCPRIHQALFNEEVEIISLNEGKNGDDSEVCITYEPVFFITHALHKPQNLFWTNAQNIKPIATLKKKNVSIEHLPATPSFKFHAPAHHVPTIVLKKPFFDASCNVTFSAGTRFVIDTSFSDEKNYMVFVFDPKTVADRLTIIPKNYALPVALKTPQEAISCFVALLKEWAHCPHGQIAYVWGGCSVIQCCPNHDCSETEVTNNGKTISVCICNSCNQCPQTGLDCAGLILRAAQICGVPYFFKNTYTLAHYLKPLGHHETVHEGDLIWIPGHVMIVSDIKNNLLIEARGYSHGFGVIHEIQLSKVFAGINTYDQLKHAYVNQCHLARMNKQGLVVENIKHCKLLKLSSAWDYAY